MANDDQTPPPTSPPAPHVIECSGHGDALWEGDIVCAACGRHHVLSDGEPPVPDVCPCGVRLMPYRRPQVGDFSARLVCRRCARQLSTHSG